MVNQIYVYLLNPQITKPKTENMSTLGRYPPHAIYLKITIMTSLSQPTKHKLQQVSTATIATCLFKKGLKNQFIQGVQRLQKEQPNMVGEAYTLRYIPAREDLNPISVFKNPNHPQRVAVDGALKVVCWFLTAERMRGQPQQVPYSPPAL